MWLPCRHLGYEVALCGADISAPDVHIVNIVWLDGRPYLVDVGYAAPFLKPLPLDLADDQEIPWGRERYVLKPRDAAIADSFADHATFMHALLIARFWPTRSVTLRNLSLVEVEGANFRARRIPDPDDHPRVIEEQFQIPADMTRQAIAGVDLTEEP